MLRVAGIPSRMVGGYRGGYYNEVGKYYLVPQKNAHVWVEAFVPQRGWIRLGSDTSISRHICLSPGRKSIFKNEHFFRYDKLLLEYHCHKL